MPDQGFGLNFDQGFNNGSFIPTGGGSGGFGGGSGSQGGQSGSQYQFQNWLNGNQFQNQMNLQQNQNQNNLLLQQNQLGNQRWLQQSQNANDLQKANLNSQTQLQLGQQAQQTASMQTAAQERMNSANVQASEYPYMLKQQNFQRVFPYFQNFLGALTGIGPNGQTNPGGPNRQGGGGLLGALGGPGGGGGAAGGGGGMGGVGGFAGQPKIGANPVWSQQQINQQVNSQAAQNDASTAGQINQMNAQLAGRGFGGNSPLAQALTAMYQGQNLANNTQNATATRWNAAQGNAQQVLSGQQAQETQFANRQNEYNQRLGTMFGTMSSLLGALGNFAG